MDNKALMRILVAIAIAVVLFFVLRHFTSGKNMESMSNMEEEENLEEGFSQTMPSENDMMVGVDATAGPGTTTTETPMMPNESSLIGGSKQSLYSQDKGVKNVRSGNCWPKEQLTPNELLPQDNSTAWAQVNPQGSGTLKDRNFLQAGHHIGINTVGQTLRNANLQLRSEPPNPQVNVSPWIQSTINPDTNRKPLEIGGCA